jgi:hypothetical protein
MNFNSYKIISRNLILILHTLFLILASIIATTSFFLIDSYIFDKTTYILYIVFIFILFLTVLCAHKFKIRILDYILFILYLYSVPRLLQYGFDPTNVSFPQDLQLNGLGVVDINNGFVSLLISLSIFFGTFILIYVYLNNKKYKFFKENNEKNNIFFSNFLFFISLMCFVSLTYLDYIIYSNPENSIFVIGRYEKTNINMLLKVFMTVFSHDIFMYLMLFWLIIDKKLNKKIMSNKYLLVLLFLFIIFYCYMGALMGSRGVGLRIILSALAIFIISPINFKSFKLTSIIIAFSVLSSFMVMFISQKTRYELHLQNEYSLKTECLNCYANKQIDTNQSNIKKSYKWLFDRMNYFDYFIITLSKYPEKICKDKYLNSLYYYKNVINFLMPGDPYPDAVISTATVFGLCYRPDIYSPVDNNGLTNFDKGTYTSQVWSMFGLLKIHSQNWMYFNIFLLTSLIGIISYFLSKCNNLIGKITYSYLIYQIPFVFLFSMGVDHSIMTAVVVIIRGMALCLFLYVIEKTRLLLLKYRL